MIHHIEGKLVEKTPTYAVIDCGGVGYQLHISLHTFSNIPDSGPCRLFAHLAIREDAHVLFGFADQDERELFLQLISVSGVGPGTARMILSSMTPSEIRGSIQAGNVTALKSIKGIGEKSAQRIIVDLKGKIGKDSAIGAAFFTGNPKIKDEALTALITLGFAKAAAEKALEKVFKSEGNVVSVEQLIKLALKNL